MLEYSGLDQGRVLDHDAALDHTYSYTAQRIITITLQGKSIEVASAPGETITIEARDVFPPAIPSGLQAVADPEGHAIDLSWQPDTEADLAGYTVYRSEAGSTAAPVRGIVARAALGLVSRYERFAGPYLRIFGERRGSGWQREPPLGEC